jgi:transcriptional regulator with XRE-family HTH domain
VRDDESIGVGIATERKLRGLTQHQPAGRAHVGPSLLRAVEQGNRAATASLVAAVARGLHVERPALTGQPYRGTTPDEEAVHAGIADLRYVAVVDPDRGRSTGLPAEAYDAARAWRGSSPPGPRARVRPLVPLHRGGVR